MLPKSVRLGALDLRLLPPPCSGQVDFLGPEHVGNKPGGRVAWTACALRLHRKEKSFLGGWCEERHIPRREQGLWRSRSTGGCWDLGDLKGIRGARGRGTGFLGGWWAEPRQAFQLEPPCSHHGVSWASVPCRGPHWAWGVVCLRCSVLLLVAFLISRKCIKPKGKISCSP